MAKKQKLLIDFCGGADQAVALLYALQSPDVQVAGIICSGPHREKGISLARNLVSLVQPNCEIPIAAGPSQPLLRSKAISGTRNEGVRLLVDKAMEADGELTVVTMGPLTALAQAAASDPSLGSKLKRVVVQGGAVRVPGDVTPVAEANFYRDPEAASFVLSAGLPLVLVPLDATAHMLLGQGQKDILVQLAKEYGIVGQDEQPEWPGAARLDAWGAMLAAIHPDQIQIQSMKLSVECQSALSVGALIADLRAKPSVGRDADVCVSIDGRQGEEWLLAVLGAGGE